MADPILLPLLQASDVESRQRQFERLLVEQATPTIESVLARFTRSGHAFQRDEAQDLHNTVVVRVLRKLNDLDEAAISDFDAYVATLAYNTVYDWMRRRFPERTRLKNRLRYLLLHDAQFALWSGAGTSLCGLASWRGRTDILEQLSIDPDTASRRMRDAAQPRESVAAILERAGQPLALDTLVDVAADLWGIVESRIQSSAENLSEHTPNPAAHYERRQSLHKLWEEIRLLPLNQRIALLLNLRDSNGVNAAALFVFVGIARYEQVAEVIGMTSEELDALWESLPLDDLTIAARLNLTRQQIINLRRSARDRLTRRTLLFEKKGRRS